MKRLFAIFAMAALCITTSGCSGDNGFEPEPTPGGPDPVEVVSLRVTEIFTDIDADEPEAIEADLAAGVTVPEGGGFMLRHGGPLSNGDYLYECTFVDADGEVAAEGTLTKTTEDAEWSSAYSFLPINTQIYFSQKWTIEREGEGEHRMDVYLAAYDGSTRLYLPSPRRYRLYEDLTEYYQTKFPDAGVRSVARVFISPPGTM